jgi:hypothetical protein
MSGVGRLWAWLSKARTRSVLAFLGAGLAAVVAALWQAYLYFAPAPTRAQPQFHSQPQLQATTAPPASIDVADAERLQASQKHALDAEATALDNVTSQIDAAGKPTSPPAPAHH